MGVRTDIRFSTYLKESFGPRATFADTFMRAIVHPAHDGFVISGGNGLIWTLADISSKMQEVGDIVAPATLDQLIVDYRNGTQTIVSDNVTMAIDDGTLANWTTGGASTQNTNIIFTLNGDANIYKLAERISFSNDNYVADETLGVTIFDFAGIRVGAQTPSGNRLVVAQFDQTGFIDAGNDPNVVANWNVEDTVVAFGTQLTQCAVNDAGTLAILCDDFGGIAFWFVGSSDPVLYANSVNPFSMLNGSASNARIASCVYSSFWGGFIIISSNGRQGGFIDASNPAAGIDSIMNVNADAEFGFTGREKFPTGAALPNGEMIFPNNATAHTMWMISPP